TFMSELASTPLNPGRPLWQFHLVENYVGGAALIMRIHHCIADGMALVQVFLSLTDASREGRPSSGKPGRWKQRLAPEATVFQRLLEPAREGLEFASQVGQRMRREACRVLQNPSVAGNYALDAAETVAELVRTLALPNDPVTRFRGRLGVRKKVAWAEPLPLEEVKAVSKAFGCTVNDVLIAAVTGALRQYMLDCGDEAAALVDIRATVPVNLRSLDHAKELGNQFGLVFLLLPLSLDSPLERLFAINARMQELKTSKQATVTLGVLAALGMGPPVLQKPVVDILSQKASAVLTNVPGPTGPLYLAGSELKEMMFWVPQNGSVGVGISILSYNGKVFFGLITDRRLVAEPGDIISRFGQEFQKFLYLSLMLPLDGRSDEEFARDLLAYSIQTGADTR
ncbi:MAG: WS/DGAT domain-containing protein, partial [Lysobacterales bacterium]